MESLTDIRDLLAERGARRSQIEVPSTQLTIDNDGHIRLERSVYELGSDAEMSLARRAGIPLEFFRSIPPPLKSYLFSHLYGPNVDSAVRKGDLYRNTGLVIEDGIRCVGIVDPRLAFLSGNDVLHTALNARPECIDEEQLVVPRFRLNGDVSVSIVSRTLQGTLRPGDIVHAGIDILHSDNGAFATHIESYFHRLACSNGMLVKICRHTTSMPIRLRRAYANNQALAIRRVHEMAQSAWGELTAKLEAMRVLAEEPADNGDAIIRVIGEQLRFPKRLIDEIIRALGEDENGRTGTLWDIIAAISRVGTHAKHLSHATLRYLQELSGELIAERLVRCPTCGTIAARRDRLLPRH